MKIEYIPILKSKKGEFTALTHIQKRAGEKILPLFELPDFTPNVRDAKRFKNSATKMESYLDELAKGIASVRPGAEVLIDISYWPPNSKTESGEHVLEHIFKTLESKGSKMCPVVGYDRWDDAEYQLALSQLEIPADRLFCIRLEADAIVDFDDEKYFLDRLRDILDSLSLTPEQTAVLIDFGDVTAASIETLIASAIQGISLLKKKWQFKFIGIAGCSLPGSITEIIPNVNSTKVILRREMLCWRAARKADSSVPLIFADYGVRNPNASDAPSPHVNGKIRYTIGNNYFVARGHSVQHDDKGDQYYGLARTVVKSKHYLGEKFSWGDGQLLAYSREETNGPGNATTWIGIDTNHHIAAVLTEVFEYERQIAADKSVVKA